MHTITFYSYKGGVGRSLLVANTAKYLSTLGKRVFALDLDLEAPGLHYKFELGTNSARTGVLIGVVDILSDFLSTGLIPESLEPYTSQINVKGQTEAIRMMRAGSAPTGDYWRSSPVSVGVIYFMDLRPRERSSFLN